MKSDKSSLEKICSFYIPIILNISKTGFQRDLVADIKEAKKGDYNDIFLKLAAGERRANHGYDIAESRALAERLVAATPKGNYIDEAVYIDVIGSTSFAQLISVFDIFSELYGEDVIEVVEPRSKGSMKQLLLTMSKKLLSLSEAKMLV